MQLMTFISRNYHKMFVAKEMAQVVGFINAVSWKTLFYLNLTEDMEDYRLVIGRRILNFEGKQTLEITQVDTQESDYFIRSSRGKIPKMIEERTRRNEEYD